MLGTTVIALVDVITYILLFEKNGWSLAADEKQFVRAVASTLCPYTDFCYTSATKRLPDENKTSLLCCNKCSCDEDCWETESCCPDSGITANEPSEHVCKATLVKQGPYDIFKTINGYSDGIKMYFIIDRCPKNYPSYNLSQKCAGKNKSTLDDFLWVSELLTGKIFQNRYCALCNGVETWTNWKIRTECKEILQTGYQGIAEKILSHGCNIIGEAPDIYLDAVDKYRCYIPKYSRCNQTGTWKSYNRDIDEACQSFTHIVFALYRRDNSLTLHRNMFCYLCNPEDKFPDVCRSSLDSDNRVRTDKISFSTLINFWEKDTYQPPVSDCDSDELNDPYLKRCRKLTCLVGAVPFYGQCKQLMVDPIGLCLRIVLLVKILVDKAHDSVKFGSVNSTELAYLIDRELKTSLGILKRNYIESEVRQKNRLEFFFTIWLFTNSEYSLDKVYKRVTKTLESSMMISFNDKNHTALTVDLETRPYEIIEQETAKLLRYDAEFSCTSEKRITTVCPTVKLNFSETRTQSNGSVKDYFLSFFQQTDQFNNGTSIHVCTEDYFRIMSQSKAPPTQVAITSCVCFSLFTVTRGHSFTEVWLFED